MLCCIGAVAQVHRARLKNGKLVAVKILHPHIETKFEVDLQILNLFASLVRFHFFFQNLFFSGELLK
jgi:predicted unusual protein kinase regulating ubiquinone biosynthesis (AarF/ABC1/UbiB family)